MASTRNRTDTPGERWRICLRFHYLECRHYDRQHYALSFNEAVGVADVWREELLLRGYKNWTLRVFDPDGVRLWYHFVKYWNDQEEPIRWRKHETDKYPVDLLNQLGSYRKSRPGIRKAIGT